MKERWKGFVFLDVHDDLLLEEHDLGCGLILRKATLEEIKDKFTKGAFNSWSERRGTSTFQAQRMPLPNADGCYRGSTLDDNEAWRYAVVECSNKDIQFWNVNLAFSLSVADLRMGYVVFENKTTRSTPFLEFPMLNIRSRLGGMFIDHKLPSFENLTELQENIAYVHSRGEINIPPEIHNLLNMFRALDVFPDDAELKFLGYFSIIEGLLTQRPSRADSVGSIQSQLNRNISLMNDRLRMKGRELSYSEFTVDNPKTVLKKLYDYRSRIAHGGDVNKSLSAMRIGNKCADKLWVHDWLRKTVKHLLMAAIIEPDLVMGLKSGESVKI